MELKLQEAQQLNEDLRGDVESTQSIVKELEKSLASAKLSKDLEVKRLQDMISVRRRSHGHS